MRNPTSRRRRRYNRPGRGRRPVKGRPRGRGGANGNRLTKGAELGPALCIKCGQPARDGKLCVFHWQLLKKFRREVPDQDPKRFRFQLQG